MDSKVSDVDNMPYTTLLYANGPGYKRIAQSGRENITGINTGNYSYEKLKITPINIQFQLLTMLFESEYSM